ncbi:OsmC family protein [Amnibacterium sp. CER49]|uniref:OsmC family protein n=1 Tax=Amnibacterium sp. CER49 TaxID=3039161 RepID=UPI002448559C|nr:OsmC family protein [Amnibacterium sp. CER49]MDH2445077.1 OsmC family protein [Amnibacterium sp. CER49]
MAANHSYAVEVEWTGNRGSGTTAYRDYDRTNTVRASGKPDLAGSADRAFFGDPDRWNPEELLVAALSQCHLLSYLHVCVRAGVVVTGYTDAATAELQVDPDGGGRLTAVTLRPRVVLGDESQRALADALHEDAHRLCFIANSVRVPVVIDPRTP